MKLYQIFSRGLLLALSLIVTWACAAADSASTRKIAIATGLKHCEDVLLNGTSMGGTQEISLASGQTATIELELQTGYYLSMWVAAGIPKVSNIQEGYYRANPLTIEYSDLSSAAAVLRPAIEEVYYFHIFDRGNSAATGAQMATNKVLYTKGEEIPECTYKLAHFEFKNWTRGGRTYSPGVKPTRLSVVPGEAVVFTAVWNQTEFLVTFDKNNSAAVLDETSRWCKSYEEYGTLPTPRAGNLVFDGWYTSPTYGAKVEATDLFSLTTNTTLYAHWRDRQYTIKFEANGGTGKMGDQVLNYSTSERLSANQFKCAGYDFVGWKVDNQGAVYANQAEVSRLAEEDGAVVVMVAQWGKQTYWVGFDGNGAQSGAMDVMRFDSRTEEKALSANGFARVGYELSGWMASDGKVYANGAKVKGLAEPGVTNVLKAVWKPCTYQVIFHANADSYTGETAEKTMEYGAALVLPACDSTCSQAEFLGWARNPKSAAAEWVTGDRIRDLTSKANDIVHLHAIWKKTSSGGGGSGGGGSSDQGGSGDQDKDKDDKDDGAQDDDKPYNTDINKALNCYTLNFETSDNKYAWETGIGDMSSDKDFDHDSEGHESVLSAELPGKGTLTFTWQAETSKPSGVYTFKVNTDVARNLSLSTTPDTFEYKHDKDDKVTVSWVAAGEKSDVLHLKVVSWKPAE